MRPRTAIVRALLVLLVLAPSGCTARRTPVIVPVAGAVSAGDPYVPGDGNGGYDVLNYDLDLRFSPRGAPSLAGTATITADATEPLSRFDLDLTGLTVSKVTVGGVPASYSRTPGELVVVPAKPLHKGRFVVGVAYSGTPREINDHALGRYGWTPTHDGVFTGDEPSGAHTWFPGNDHPADKATFGFRITVPKGLTAIANGELSGTTTSGGSTTYTWRERRPMATYLAMVDVGRFRVRTGRTAGGVPVYVAVDPSVASVGLSTLYKETVQVTDLWTTLFGPYPFDSTGGVIDDAPVQFALETQTRPEYAAGIAASPTVIAHELSHQWFGDSVTPARWSDMWLNEGFATYAEWMWGARQSGGVPMRRQFDARYAQKTGDLWTVAPAAPGRRGLFGRAVYERGAMTLQALRQKVGGRTFFAILRSWTAEHRYANATTPEFVALAEHLSGKPLGPFFQAWLYGKGRPAHW